ncbi:MAG: hypothetical protein K2V38_03510, partial [Gemmataceae bacterium]|nr:hypothetical protein [Gemmataceae bacterium]
MTRLALLTVLTALSAALLAPAASAAPVADPKQLAIPPAELVKARELVRQLGNDTFAEREAAERELAAMGRAARAALFDGATNETD